MSERTERRVEALFWAAFAAAVVPNAVEALIHVEGAWWAVLRWSVTVAFVAALVALAVTRLRRRRAP